jgi:competence protein ComEC
VIDGLAMLAGVLLGLGSAALPAAPWMLVASASVTLVLPTRLRHRTSLRFGAWLLAGMLLSWGGTRHWQSLRVPTSTADARLLFEGHILSVPAREGAELRFDVAGIVVDSGDARERIARLVWRDARVAPRAGERWRLLVRLAPAAETHNFAGADTARFAFRDRVHLAGRVFPSNLNLRLELAEASVDSLRARVAARISDQVSDPDAAALLIALAVGLTDRMSADQWRVFNATGTTHLVAISGLHITLFALVAFFIARLLWWSLHCLPWAFRIDREPFAVMLGLSAAGAYSLLAGFSVPTQRTWLMLACVALGKLSARHAGAGRTWTLALIAVLLLDPFAPLSAGFWLSFVAVGVILAASSAGSSGANTSMARASSVVRLQLAIMLALAPLTFAVFDGLSIAGLWVNLIAIPLVSFVLVPLVLIGTLAALVMPAMSELPFDAAASLYDFTWPGLTWAADGELALWHATPSPWWIAFAALSAVVLLRRWPWVLRLSAVCVALPLLFVPARGPGPGTARISILDAGRGSAVLVLTQSRTLLFDTADSWHTQGARLRKLVLPVLDALGRRAVDLLVLPSLNEDRARGAALLAFERHVHRVWVGGGWPATSLPVAACADSFFRWDGVEFRTYMGGPEGRYCVLRVSAGRHAILLAGDLDVAAERALVSRLTPAALASDVALLSRQGSSLGSAPEWIEATGAALAIATGGIAESRSRAETLERWRRSGAEILDTRRQGGIELGLGTDGVRVLGLARVSRYPFVWRRSQ